MALLDVLGPLKVSRIKDVTKDWLARSALELFRREGWFTCCGLYLVSMFGSSLGILGDIPSDATARFIASMGLNTTRLAANWRTVLITGTALRGQFLPSDSSSRKSYCLSAGQRE